MTLKNKKILLLIVAIVTVLVIGGVVLNYNSHKNAVTVIDYGMSLCTMDVPSSTCSSYQVTVQSSDGTESTYTVRGFSDANSEQYDSITSKIHDAKRNNTTVKIQVANDGEITAVQ